MKPAKARPPAKAKPGKAKSAAKGKSSSAVGCISILVFVAVIGGIIYAVTSGSGGSSATWKAAVEDYNVINPADLAVTVRVTNTGTTAGTPTCTVQASDPSNTYIGTDGGTLTKPIKAGSFGVYVDNLTITHQGARYITNVTVSCTS